MDSTFLKRSIQPRIGFDPLAPPLSRCPYLTVGISVLAVAAVAIPNLGVAWQLERGAVHAGETWRILTCHLCHWSADHFIWDVLTFLVLGASCETWSRKRFLAAALGGALVISASVWLRLPELHAYRGLSGIDCSLFALLSVLLIRERAGTPAAALGSLLLAAAFLKVTYEVVTGTTLFVGSAAGVMPLPIAHVSGGLAGIAAGLWPSSPLKALGFGGRGLVETDPRTPSPRPGFFKRLPRRPRRSRNVLRCAASPWARNQTNYDHVPSGASGAGRVDSWSDS